METQARLPRPLKANTDSITIEPPSMKPNWTAATETTGMIEGRIQA
ncbi:unnamed protein product, partial [marine sediment metagenome]